MLVERVEHRDAIGVARHGLAIKGERLRQEL
jgi:hypothetical protein